MVEKGIDMFSEEAKRIFKKRIEDDENESRMMSDDGMMDKDSFLNGVLMADRLKGNLRGQFYSNTEDDDEEHYYGMRPDDETEGAYDERTASDLSTSLMTQETMATYPD
jgi:hypothetical protein